MVCGAEREAIETLEIRPLVLHFELLFEIPDKSTLAFKGSQSNKDRTG